MYIDREEKKNNKTKTYNIYYRLGSQESIKLCHEHLCCSVDI